MEKEIIKEVCGSSYGEKSGNIYPCDDEKIIQCMERAKEEFRENAIKVFQDKLDECEEEDGDGIVMNMEVIEILKKL